MTHANETPAPGERRGLEGCQNSHAGSASNSHSPLATQTFFASLQREIAEYCFRVAAIQLIHAADLLVLGDDRAAWDCVDVAEARYSEGAGALRELEPAP